MTARQPIAARRAIWLLSRLGARRFLNRLASRMGWHRRRDGSDGARTGTPRRAGGGSLLVGLLVGLFLLTSFFIADELVERLVAGADLRSPVSDIERGAVDWPAPRNEPLLLQALGLLLSVLFAAQLASSIGSANQDLAHVEWSMAWLYTLPAGTRTLFAAKILEYTLVGAGNWFMFFPLLCLVFWNAGHGFGALPEAFAGTLYIALVTSSLRILLETRLRRSLPLRHVKNAQAILTVVAVLLLYSAMLVAVTANGTRPVYALAHALPMGLVLLPWNLPLLWASSGHSAGWTSASLAATGALFFAAGVLGSSLLVRRGLLGSPSGVETARRGPAAAVLAARGWGVIGKEALLLARDRNFFVRTLVVPVLVVCFQILVNRGWQEAATTNLDHAAMTAFGIGAYVLMYGGFFVLLGEGNALWLLYTIPRRLESLLLQKAMLWAGIGALYVLAVLACIVGLGREFKGSGVGSAVMAFAGIVIYAFIASGFGVLATDPQAREVVRRIRPRMSYTYLFLAGMYGYGIYANDVWSRLGLITLCTLLAYAIWQKVRDQIPYLLDPTASPPPRLTLSDGLIAALAFFVLQGFIGIVFDRVESALPNEVEQAIGYVGAGLLVVVTSLFSSASEGTESSMVYLGLARAPGARSGVLGATGAGLLAGILAAALGLGYVAACDWFEPLRQLRDSVEPVPVELWILYACLGVVAAPVFEEFIFRGLVYRGMRGNLSVAWSALGSAAIFAVVHPPVAAIPVFLMGILAALVYERTRLLWAPILAHMVYNGAIVYLSRPA